MKSTLLPLHVQRTEFRGYASGALREIKQLHIEGEASMWRLRESGDKHRGTP